MVMRIGGKVNLARKESSRNREECSNVAAILRNVSFREEHGKGERKRYGREANRKIKKRRHERTHERKERRRQGSKDMTTGLEPNQRRCTGPRQRHPCREQNAAILLHCKLCDGHDQTLRQSPFAKHVRHIIVYTACGK
jgi:hypothetical protein